MSEPARAEIIKLPVTRQRRTARGAPAEPGLSRAEICLQLRDLQRLRLRCIKTQSKGDRGIEAHLVGLIEVEGELDREARKALFKLAGQIRRAIEKEGYGWKPDKKLAPRWRGKLGDVEIVLGNHDARRVFDRLRGQYEKKMRDLARELPVWPWVKKVKGVAELGLAVIVAEAGRDLAKFETAPKLWKMLGLAVLEGRRQGNPELAGKDKEEQKEAWQTHGYKPQRRAEIWAFLSETMLRSQWRNGGNNGGPGWALGPYGEIYAERKLKTANERDWTPKHIDNDARRIMSKRFLRDLWVAWQATAAPQG